MKNANNASYEIVKRIKKKEQWKKSKLEYYVYHILLLSINILHIHAI